MKTTNKSSKINKVKAFLLTNCQFRYNEVSTVVEYKKTNEEAFQSLTDREIHSILFKLENNRLPIQLTALRALLNSDFVPVYNPFTTYFNALPEVTGTENIKKLLKTVKTHDDEFFAWACVKWLVAWVACILDPSIINQQCMIFAGAQGIGKSTWIERLVPLSLRPYYYSGVINLGNKDTLGYISQKILVNLDELASMTYKNVKELKELVTKGSIDFRKAYGYLSESYVRRASFIASINDLEFLYDLTGNRRFLSFEVLEIENRGRHSVDIDMVFAELYQLYKSGFQYWFDGDDQVTVEANNQHFIIVSAEEEKLLNVFSPVPPYQENSYEYAVMMNDMLGQHPGESNKKYRYRVRKNQKLTELVNKKFFMTTNELYRKLFNIAKPSPGDLVRFGKIINKHGFARVSHEGVKKYEVYCYNIKDSPVDFSDYQTV